MCTDVYKKKCVQEKNVCGAHSLHVYKKNGAANKEFFDVYKMCTEPALRCGGSGLGGCGRVCVCV